MLSQESVQWSRFSGSKQYDCAYSAYCYMPSEGNSAYPCMTIWNLPVSLWAGNSWMGSGEDGEMMKWRMSRRSYQETIAVTQIAQMVDVYGERWKWCS